MRASGWSRSVGVLSATAFSAGLWACTTTMPGPGMDDDAGVTDVGKADGKADTKPVGLDSGPPDTTASTENKTTGKACKDDAECDPLETGSAFCSPTGFTSGSLYPTPVCFNADCDPGDGSKITLCDGDTGVCLSTGSGGICLPSCEFDDSTAAPKGCAGKNKCNVYGWGTESSMMKTIGIGYCFGGCIADADCPTGNKCQKEDGLCVKTLVTYTKTPGTACTDADAKAPAKCNCLYTTKEKAGYCANTCYVGVSDCGAGFTCDASLPKEKLFADDVVFTAVPAGLAGYCLKNCTSDADCTGLNAYCGESGGMAGKKTCQIGKKPCATDANCPSGVTCVGATATNPGRCGG